MKKGEKVEKYIYYARELKKALEHEGEGHTNCSWCVWTSPQGLQKETARIKNQIRDHPDHNIEKIG